MEKPITSKRVIFTGTIYETIMKILDDFELGEKHRQIDNEILTLLPRNEEKIDSLLEELPGRFLAQMSKKIILENIGDKEAISEISNKFDFNNEKSGELLKILKEKIVPRTEVISIKEDTEQAEKIDDFSPLEKTDDFFSPEKSKKEKLPSTISKKSDPYREKVE